MSKTDRLKNMSKAVTGADLKTEKEKREHSGKVELKNKNLRYSKEWDTIITNNYGGTVTAYILMAIQNQMKSDGFL